MNLRQAGPVLRTMDDVVIDMIAVGLGGRRKPGSVPGNHHNDLSLGGPGIIGDAFHFSDIEPLIYWISVHLIVKPVQLADPVAVDV